MKKALPLLFALAALLVCASAGAQSCPNHEIDLSWSYVQGSDPAVGFDVFAKEQGQTSFQKINTTTIAITQLSYVDCTPLGGYLDSYYVTAVDAAGTQSPSNTWTTPAAVPVDPVNGVQVTHNNNGSNTVVWGSSPDAGTYSVSRSASACGTSGATFTGIAAGLTATNFTDASPPPAAAWCYGVATLVNGVSSPVVFGGVQNPPAAPTVTGRIVK